MSAQNRIYAILEIQKRQLIFSAFKVSHQHHLLLYKEHLKSEASWLDDNGCFIDLNQVTLKLTAVLRDFANLYPHIVLTKIAIVMPTTWLSIRYLNHDFYPGLPIDHNLLRSLKIEAEQPQPKHRIIETKTLNWVLDNKPMDLDRKAVAIGTKLTYQALSYEVPTITLDSYYQLLNLLGLDCLWVTTNLQALFRLVANDHNHQRSFLIANWTFDTIEIGYFESGLLKHHLVYNQGLDSLKQKLMTNLMLPKAKIDHYLFDLINYGTTTNGGHTVLQKWDNHQKILKKYNLKQFKKELQLNLQHLYFLAQKELFSHTDKPGQLWNYHFGTINSICGVESLMNYGRGKNHLFHQEVIIGTWNSNLYQVPCGIIKTLERLNNYLPNPTIYTSIGNFVKPSEVTKTTVNFDNFNILINETLALKSS